MTDYPIRQGSSVADWTAHILDVLAWNERHRGAPIWSDGTTTDELGARGLKAVEALVAAGRITFTTEVEHTRAMRGSTAFGRTGYLRPRRLERFMITRAG